MNFLSNAISGLSLGSIYALIALGYTMVYGIAKMLNFAHGDIIMVGAFAAIVSVVSLGFSPIIAIIVCIAVCVIFGVLIEKLAYKPLRTAPPLSVLITAIGVSYFLQSIALIIFGSNQRSFPKIINVSPVHIGGLTINGESIATLIVSIIIMICLTLFINKTKMGKAMRSVSEDKEAAELMGVSVNKTISTTFAIGSSLAAVAGIFFGSTYGFIGPYSGSMPGIKAFVAAVFGGIGSIPGAMVGGILLGIIESMSKAYISTELSDAIVFGILIIVLLFKPTGLLGKKINEKV
ncbi:High-affinity branched-chain amino acid transport system permease protein LivH [bioreactor metagenome]|uniref:High-affinity branched-chain amino acid transport system permease protein LivH n=1 Tax=bioreactor metagenome TaxID=1076179 RepID=A0A644YUX6_9ZZZZ